MLFTIYTTKFAYIFGGIYYLCPTYPADCSLLADRGQSSGLLLEAQPLQISEHIQCYVTRSKLAVNHHPDFPNFLLLMPFIEDALSQLFQVKMLVITKKFSVPVLTTNNRSTRTKIATKWHRYSSALKREKGEQITAPAHDKRAGADESKLVWSRVSE